MEKQINMIFKIGVLLIGVTFLVLYFFHSQNGRFHYVPDAHGWYFLDTRTGVVYADDEYGFNSTNYTNGKVKFYKLTLDKSSEPWPAPKGPKPAPGAPAAPPPPPAPGAPRR
jgi:hypothetical protein